MDSIPPAKLPSFSHALTAFRAATGRPKQVALTYFDQAISYGALDAASDALAARLQGEGVQHGDRIALYLQNMPGFIIGLLAAWKLGAVPVPVNPMNRQRELAMLLADCTPAAMVCQDTLYREVIQDLQGKPAIIVTSAAGDWQTRNDPRLFPATPSAPGAAIGTIDLAAIVAGGGAFAARAVTLPG